MVSLFCFLNVTFRRRDLFLKGKFVSPKICETTVQPPLRNRPKKAGLRHPTLLVLPIRDLSLGLGAISGAPIAVDLFTYSKDGKSMLKQKLAHPNCLFNQISNLRKWTFTLFVLQDRKVEKETHGSTSTVRDFTNQTPIQLTQRRTKINQPVESVFQTSPTPRLAPTSSKHRFRFFLNIKVVWLLV